MLESFSLTLRGVRVLSWNVTSSTSSYRRTFPLTTLSVLSQHDSCQRLEGERHSSSLFCFQRLLCIHLGRKFYLLSMVLSFISDVCYPKSNFRQLVFTVNTPRSLKLTWISSGCVAVTENPTLRERGIGVVVHSCHLADFTWCPLMPLHAEFALYLLFA